jgi:cellulose synthase/poly-beta-1,6-N-acetylglucosamine synthase-like glycosyltransferase
MVAQRHLSRNSSMISVIIPTHDSERALAQTLAALVPGALDGVVREVIVTDAGSRDGTAKVADVAGCHFMPSPGSLGSRLAEAAATARAQWLWFVQPGSVPGTGWIDETARFVRERNLAADSAAAAAVFRARVDGRRSPLSDVFTAVRALVGGRPKPSQGLLIAKSLYDTVGKHRADGATPEVDLIGRLGRQRIVTLDCTMTQAG